MDAMEFHNRMYVMNSNSLVFSSLEVLFLVMGQYGDTGVADWEIPSDDDGDVDMWDF